jgi:GH25 family lysozyme M1 (1,4-beta-N-acetylmuramidase)
MLHPNYPICGCDVSYWQRSIDYAKLTAMGLRFVIARTSNGTTLDSRYAGHIAGAKQAGLPFGAYHFWQGYRTPSQNTATMIKAQKEYPPMGIWLDLEAQTDLNLAKSSEHIYKTLRLLDAYYDGLAGIYTNQSSWRRLVSPTYYSKMQLANRKLWVANWFVNFVKQPNLPSGWPHWDLWQFSAETGPHKQTAAKFGIAGSKSLDIDAFNGVESDFEYLIGQTE